MAKTFGAESTADEVLEGVSLSGKRVLITGVSAGLGVETARSAVAHGATVVGTARDLTKARNALAEAGEHCGLRVLGVKAKELSERGSAYLPRVQGMGKALGPPWTQDQKSATLVAWLALSGFAL